MAYYEIIFGSGFYDCYRYVVKTEQPTTDYGGLTDCLIDYLKEKGHRNIIESTNYRVKKENGYEYIIDEERNRFNSDEYVIGGNCGDILLHYGDFRINEISENEIKDAEIVEV